MRARTVPPRTWFWLATVLLVTSCGNGERSATAKAPPARDTTPSMDETRAWIAKRLPELTGHYVAYRPAGRYGTSPGGMATRTLQALLDTACTLRIEQEVVHRTVEFGTDTGRMVYRIPLREVDPQSVHAERRESSPGLYSLEPFSAVFVSIVGERKLIVDSSTRRDSVSRDAFSHFGWGAQDQNAAERVARALRRAVELCGGRADAF